VKRADDLVAARNLTGPGIDMTMWQDWMVFQILRQEARDLIAESEAPESERPR
jgi:hypothetical protein